MKEYSSKSEGDLIQLLQRNDEQALASLMRLYYNDLYNYGARFTNDSSLIKDCIQEVFISLWQRRETANTILSPKYYFLRAIKNKILKALYKNSHHVTLSGLQRENDSFYEFSIEQIIIEKQVNEEKVQKVRKTLALLSKKQKEIIYLKYYQYLDHGQIAELMNLTRQSVYNLLHETLHKLRTLLGAEFIAQ
ncbi:MAG: RNA polymerase sigma factor [Chitinophagales bacterium]